MTFEIQSFKNLNHVLFRIHFITLISINTRKIQIIFIICTYNSIYRTIKMPVDASQIYPIQCCRRFCNRTITPLQLFNTNSGDNCIRKSGTAANSNARTRRDTEHLSSSMAKRWPMQLRGPALKATYAKGCMGAASFAKRSGRKLSGSAK